MSISMTICLYIALKNKNLFPVPGYLSYTWKGTGKTWYGPICTNGKWVSRNALILAVDCCRLKLQGFAVSLCCRDVTTTSLVSIAQTFPAPTVRIIIHELHIVSEKHDKFDHFYCLELQPVLAVRISITSQTICILQINFSLTTKCPM